MNHWASSHSLCEECPAARKVLNQVATVFVWIFGSVIAAFALWYSPTIYHRGVVWFAAYNACVEMQLESEPLENFFKTRVLCSRLASTVRVTRRPLLRPPQ